MLKKRKKSGKESFEFSLKFVSSTFIFIEQKKFSNAKFHLQHLFLQFLVNIWLSLQESTSARMVLYSEIMSNTSFNALCIEFLMCISIKKICSGWEREHSTVSRRTSLYWRVQSILFLKSINLTLWINFLQILNVLLKCVRKKLCVPCVPSLIGCPVRCGGPM